MPADDLADHARPSVVQDAEGKRYAYPLPSGELRLVYALEGGLFVGPRVKAPLDFGTAPDLDHALGALYENAGSRRAALVADVRKTKGEGSVARLLVEGAAVPGPEWDEAFAKLPPANAAEVRTSLAPLLEKGKPTAGLRRAVSVVPLREPARAAVLAGRIRELGETLREPRASAVLLRALAMSDKAQASVVACEVLTRGPLDPKNAKGTPEEIDAPGRAALAEAATLAIAAAGSDCKEVAPLLAEETCLPSFRCGPAGPLDGRAPTKQDEPLCTKEELAPLVQQELERTPADVLALRNGTRAPLFAYVALAITGKVPPAFVTAHARRRYALVQPEGPICDRSLAVGTACHCDEPTVRDQTCRHVESQTVSVGVCKFDIDDKQKKLTNVVVTTPP